VTITEIVTAVTGLFTDLGLAPVVFAGAVFGLLTFMARRLGKGLR